MYSAWTNNSGGVTGARVGMAIGADDGSLEHATRGREVRLAAETGPLGELEGSHAIVICDVENLSLSASGLGCTVCYRTLAAKLKAASCRCSLHAFFSCTSRDRRRILHFLSSGWTPHPQRPETVRTWQGKRSRTNSDNAILFNAGVLLSGITFDTVIIASGDGDLVSDLARFVSELQIPRQVFTLSLPGSTSARLNAETNRLISGNLEVGKDCLRGLAQKHD